MTTARFPREPMTSRANPPQWLAFVWAVNDALTDTFAEPTNQPDTPRQGYVTEQYPQARIIWGPTTEEGVRIIADTPQAAAAFRAAAAQMDIHLTES